MIEKGGSSNGGGGKGGEFRQPPSISRISDSGAGGEPISNRLSKEVPARDAPLFSDKADKSSQVIYPASESKDKPDPQEVSKEVKASHIEDSIIPPTKEGEYPQLPAIFGERTIYSENEETWYANWMKDEVTRAIDTAPNTTIALSGDMVKEDHHEAKKNVSNLRDLPEDAPIYLPPLERENVPGLATVEDPYDFYNLLTDAVVKSMPDIPSDERKKEIDRVYRHEMAHAARAKESGLPLCYGVRFSYLSNMDGRIAFSAFVHPTGTVSKRDYREIFGAPREINGTDKINYDQLAPKSEK